MDQIKPTRKAGTIQGIVIIGINLLPMMAIVALMPVVPAIKDRFKDMPNILTWAPLVLSAPGLCIALLSPYAGFLTDKLGRRKLLLIFVALYGFGGILPFFVDSFPFLMGGRLILGIGEAFLLTIANTLLGDYFSHKDRTKWLMVQGIIGSTCGTLLLSLSGYLATMGWQFPFLVYGLAFLITIATYFFIFEPEKQAAPAAAKTVAATKIPLNLIVQICGTTLIASIIYFVYTLQFSLALDSMGLTRQEIGNYSALSSIAVPIGALLFKLFSNKTIQFQMLLTTAFIGSGLIGIGLAQDLPMVVGAAWVQQLGCGMLMPVLIAWSLRSLPDEFRGRGMGFWSSAFFLGQFVSPLAVTAMRGLTGSLLGAFVAFGVLCVVLGVLNYFFTKKTGPTLLV